MDFEKQYEFEGVETPRKTSNGFFKGLLVGILFMLIFFTAIVAVIFFFLWKTGGTIAVSSGKAGAQTVVGEATISKMKTIEDMIRNYYYQEDIDAQALEDGIYDGMVDSLGDPYSTYYSQAELEKLMESTKGVYYGIGAYVSLDSATGYAVISGTIAGTPAEEAGLRSGDIIYEVDGNSTAGLELSEVVAMIKGEAGTEVTLTLVRPGAAENLEKVLKRSKIETPTVNYEIYDDGTAYLQITEFDEVTTDQFIESYAAIKAHNVKGMILDLRGNPGGSLQTVCDIARQILPEGLIVYTEDRDGNRTEYTCDGKNEIDIPLVVLVNGYSASASEILSGAIKDYGIGTLVGTQTFGKGIVQRIISLSDNSAVKLTVSSYYTPNGINIHGVGIEPDIICEFDSERYYGEEAYDNQREKAKEVLQELMK